MLLFCCLEVGHVHTAAFVISDRPINHGRAVSMPSGFALQVACPSGCPGSNLHVLPPFLRLLSLCALTPWNGSPCMPSVHIPLSPLSFYQLQFPLSLPLELKFYVLHRLSNQKADTLASLKVWKSRFSVISFWISLFFILSNRSPSSQSSSTLCLFLSSPDDYSFVWATQQDLHQHWASSLSKCWHVLVPRCFNQPCSTHTPVSIPSSPLSVQRCSHRPSGERKLKLCARLTLCTNECRNMVYDETWLWKSWELSWLTLPFTLLLTLKAASNWTGVTMVHMTLTHVNLSVVCINVNCQHFFRTLWNI